MLDGTKQNTKDTFVPSPGSLRPPEYPKGVEVPAGVGGPIPVPAPAPPVPVGGRVGGRGRGRGRVPGGVVPVPGGGQQQQQQQGGQQQQQQYGYYGMPDQPPVNPTVNEMREMRMPDGNTYPSRWLTAADTGGVGRWEQNGGYWNTAQAVAAIAARQAAHAQPQIGITGAGRGQAQRLLVAGPYVGQPQGIPNNQLRFGQNQTVRVRGRSYVSQWVPAGWGGRQTTQGHWEFVRSFLTGFSGRGRGRGRQTHLGFGPQRSMHLSS